MKISSRVLVFDASDIVAESKFWAGLLGGVVHPDEDWHSSSRRRVGHGGATCPKSKAVALTSRRRLSMRCSHTILVLAVTLSS